MYITEKKRLPIFGNTSIVAWTPSSCRAPWFDTIIAAAPCSYACKAVLTVKTPLITIGNFDIDLSHSTSFQVSDWSNKLETYSLIPELPLLFTVAAMPKIYAEKNIQDRLNKILGILQFHNHTQIRFYQSFHLRLPLKFAIWRWDGSWNLLRISSLRIPK